MSPLACEEQQVVNGWTENTEVIDDGLEVGPVLLAYFQGHLLDRLRCRWFFFCSRGLIINNNTYAAHVYQ